MSCAAAEVGNMPLFYSPDWSKYFHGSPILLVWVGNVWSSLVCSSGWAEYWWYFSSLKARRERYAVSQHWGTPVKTYGDSGRYTAGGLVEAHVRVLKITVSCWLVGWVFFNFHKQLFTAKQSLRWLEPHWQWQRELRRCNGHIIFAFVRY